MVVLVIVVGIALLRAISLWPSTASFIPDLPLVPDKVKHLPLGKTRPRFFSREVSKSYIMKVRGCIMNWKMSLILLPHLNSGFSGTRNKGDIYPFFLHRPGAESPLNPAWGVKLSCMCEGMWFPSSRDESAMLHYNYNQVLFTRVKTWGEGVIPWSLCIRKSKTPHTGSLNIKMITVNIRGKITSI